jgi:hypothetical protein
MQLRWLIRLIWLGFAGAVLAAALLYVPNLGARALNTSLEDCKLIRTNRDGTRLFLCPPEATATTAPTTAPNRTATPTHGHTQTPPPAGPTATAPAPTNPAPTATRASGSTAPHANAPLCPSHDPNQWHGLWDSARGCHYDHEHGDDPALGNAYFGPLSYAGGQTISYVWATSHHENTMKHGGYKISVRTPEHNPWPGCGFMDNYEGIQPINCIVASRIQYHQVGGTMDSLARYHSYYAEYYVCRYPAHTDCGVMRIGGWADFGSLHSPHYNGRVVRPGGTVDFGLGSTYGGAGMQLMMNLEADTPDLPHRSGEPYTFDLPYSSSEMNWYRNNPPWLDGGMTQWSMNDLDCEPIPAGHPCHNPYARFFTIVADTWNLLDKNNPNNIRWICRDGGCAYNGSIRSVGEVSLRVLPAWDADGDGFADMQGYTDRWGNPVSGCSTAGLDCVPFSLERAPVGTAANHSDNGCLCTAHIEYDVSPSGVRWIKFPN